ncbi:hypothetical protein [Geodermatophilus sp. SYSU D01176]
MDWSLDRLPEPERDLAEHLAVFAGGCTEEAASAVIGRDVAGTTDLLVALVDRSIVTPRHVAGRTRYGVLEPIRARAEHRLRERGLLGDARHQHAEYFVHLAARAGRGLRTSEAAHWIDTVDQELPNLRSACSWSLDSDDGDTALRLLAPLYLYAWSQLQSELSEWAEAACSRPAAAGHPALPAVLALAALGAWRRGDLPRAEQLAQQATVAAGPPEMRALALQAFADIPLIGGRPVEATARYRMANAVAAEAGDRFLELLSAADVALARGYAGDDDAGAAADEVCARAERLGAPWIVAYACYNAGEVHLERSPDRAHPLLRRAEQLARTAGDRFTAAAAGLSATSIEVRTRNPDTALTDLARLLDEWHRAGSWNSTWLTMRLCIDVLVRVGEHEVAAQLVGALRASATAGPVYGADVERLAHAQTTMREELGDTTYEALVRSGATLGDDGAVALARRELRDRMRSA